MPSDRKKNPRADLERKRWLFFQIGLIAALSLVLLAFEWKSYDRIELPEVIFGGEAVPEEIIPVTRQEQVQPIQLPVPKQHSEIIEVVDNSTDVNDNPVNNETTEPTDPMKDNMNESPGFDAEIFTIVEEPPSFPGGEEERIRFLQRNIIYPQLARQNKIQGRVYVTFVVEPDGSITNIRILQGIGAGCDEEAVRVVRSMPKWIPGKQRGVPVRVMLNMPLAFTLQN